MHLNFTRTKFIYHTHKSFGAYSICIMQQYPYDLPTEAFPFEIFKQAFAAVQSCVVHLQVKLTHLLHIYMADKIYSRKLRSI